MKGAHCVTDSSAVRVSQPVVVAIGILTKTSSMGNNSASETTQRAVLSGGLELSSSQPAMLDDMMHEDQSRDRVGGPGRGRTIVELQHARKGSDNLARHQGINDFCRTEFGQPSHDMFHLA